MMRSLRLGSILLATLAMSAAPALEARTVVGGMGSRGDRFDTDECPRGQVMVGAAAKAGAWLNGIQIVCAPLRPDGTSDRGGHRGPVRGADSGTPVEQSCPLGGKVSRLKAIYTSDERKQVYGVVLTCLPTGGAYIAGTDHPLDDGGVLDQLMLCQDGEFVTGLAVNSGRHVNNIGIVCDIVDPPAPPPPPPPPPEKRVISHGGKANAGVSDPNRVGQFDLPFESESSLGGKFDVKFQVVGMFKNPSRFHVTGTITNTDIGPQYNGTFDGEMSFGDTRTVSLTYIQPAVNARGTVVFRFSEDGETFVGDGMHGGNAPFKWTGRRKRGPN